MKPKTMEGKEIDNFIFKISAIVRNNFSDVDVVMEEARIVVYQLLKSQRQELKKKVEGMKMVLTKTEKELALRINKEALSACEAQVQFYNQALDDILTLLEEENEDRSKTRE